MGERTEGATLKVETHSSSVDGNRASEQRTQSMVQIPFYRTGAPVKLQLFGTVGAIHLLIMKHKALVGQVHGAFFAVEAVVVPGLSFIGHHTGAFTKPCGKTQENRENS